MEHSRWLSTLIQPPLEGHTTSIPILWRWILKLRICTWAELSAAWTCVPNLILFFPEMQFRREVTMCISMWSMGVALGETEALSEGLLEKKSHSGHLPAGK